jgi:Mg-chelatase subunit ChlD
MLIKNFTQDRNASVAPIFGITLFTLVGVTGAAVDYSRASAARTAVQNALDATGLMLSKDAEGLSTADLTTRANTYFQGILSNKTAKNVTVTTEFYSPLPGSYSLRLTAKGSVDATFSRVMGKDILDIGTSSDITWGIKRLELALVLDNTGSMSKLNKLQELKTAAHNLLTKLETASKKPDDIKVAIVPFDTTVNIGTGFMDSGWIDYTVKGISKSQWEGCVIDRSQSFDVNDTAPTTTNYKTLYPAANCGELVTVEPLTNNWSTLHSKVDSMKASGYTNVTIGLAWGWHALTPGVPFTNAQPPADDLDKVIVLLTDGLNTQNRWTTNASSIDARTALACANAKAAGFKIYTVRVIEGDADLLRSCATNPSMYYDVQQASQLTATFNSIAQSLASLRIAK